MTGTIRIGVHSISSIPTHLTTLLVHSILNNIVKEFFSNIVVLGGDIRA